MIKRIAIIVLVLLNIGCDQISKKAVRKNVDPYEYIQVVSDNLILLYRILRKKDLDKFMVIAFAFVIGGGIGNLIDRIAHGSVTDFFVIEFGFFKTGIFNMADVSVSSGVLMILLLSLRSKKSML